MKLCIAETAAHLCTTAMPSAPSAEQRSSRLRTEQKKKETDSLLDKYKKNIEDSKHFTPSGPQYEYQQPNSESRQADASEHFTPNNGSAISADTIQPPPEMPEEKEKKKEKMLKIILIVLAVILIIVIAVVSIMMGKERADNEMAVPDKTASAATQIADENSDGDKGGQQRIVVQRKRPRPKKSDYKDPDHILATEYLSTNPSNKKYIKKFIKANKNGIGLAPSGKASYTTVDGVNVLKIPVILYNGGSLPFSGSFYNIELFSKNKIIAWTSSNISFDHVLVPGELWGGNLLLYHPLPESVHYGDDLQEYENTYSEGYIPKLSSSLLNGGNMSIIYYWDN